MARYDGSDAARIERFAAACLAEHAAVALDERRRQTVVEHLLLAQWKALGEPPFVGEHGIRLSLIGKPLDSRWVLDAAASEMGRERLLPEAFRLCQRPSRWHAEPGAGLPSRDLSALRDRALAAGLPQLRLSWQLTQALLPLARLAWVEGWGEAWQVACDVVAENGERGLFGARLLLPALT